LTERPAAEWVARLRARGVPCEEVPTLASLFRDAQVEANGLVQEIRQPGIGAVSLLGNLFKFDGTSVPARRPAPARGEHGDEILRELGQIAEADMRA
jgi:crotonobetainyl-CoA:carnitine CoA-transferase CaiB-like acyl-CoA transferase